MTASLAAGDRVAERYSVQAALSAAPHDHLYRAVTDWGDTVLANVIEPPHADTPAGARVRQAVMRNARLLAQVQHPHVQRVVDLHDTPERQVVVLDDRLHQSLRAAGQGRPLKTGSALEIARTLFGALAAAHGQALLHTRLSPDHVWFDAQGQLLLGHFGLATRALQELRAGPVPDVRYAAPELLAGGTFSPQSDVYALGATLHEALSGAACPPASARAQGVPLPPLPPGTPNALRRALEDALQLDPAQRAVSASEVLERLNRADAVPEPEPEAVPITPPVSEQALDAPLGDHPAAAPVRVTRPQAARPPAMLIGALIGGALLLGAGLRLLQQGAASTPGNVAALAAVPKDSGTTAAPPDVAAPEAAPEPDEPVLPPSLVNTTTLNLRAEPSSAAAVLSTFSRGDRLTVLESQGEWLRVQGANSASGWVKADLTLPLRPPEDVQALLAALEAGEELQLERGVYVLDQPVTVRGPLTLRGAGMKDTVILSAAAEDTLIFQQADATLSDLTVAHAGTLPARSLQLDGGHLTLNRVQLAGAVRDDDLSEYGSGLWVKGDSEAVIHTATFTANAFGLYVSDTSHVDVSASTFSGNRDGGLYFRDASGGTVEGNTIQATAAHGIHVTDHADPTISANRIHDNRGRGVTVYGQAIPTLQENTIENNVLQGVGVQDYASPTLTGNVIQNNRQSGVTYFDNAGGTAQGNTVQNNRTAGFRMMNAAQPVLDGNTVTRNRENGLAYSDNAAGTARNNTITGSGNPGIATWGDAQPQLLSNTVTGGKQSGVVIAERSGGAVNGNEISGNALYGLIVTGQADPAVNMNTVHANGSGGIFYKQDAMGSGYGNTCYDNRGPDLSADLSPGNPGPDFAQDACNSY
ncbi:right-handed parallel beta-helix repeat-containing protein [Deinococcus arenae]|uniref:right-handed parallel beta-helix repeat-containing protein n=1 Tax=Deinococcus arenae TaxID=1452751 RepID=UPI001662F143|nr:right-handed parallel beta-helix repeat-containing protein [Deinococcus arenae]